MLNISNDQRKLLPTFEQLFTTTAQAPGGVARLRELILTLAVQGKLVPQDASDEPASELLKKISAEKERLIAEGKIKKDKPLAAITEEDIPFELPAGWEWVPLGEVIDVIRGITFPASEKTREPAKGRIACLRTANIQHEIEWDDILYVSKDFMSREEQALKDEDIVMSMANSRELVGKVALVRGIPTGLATFGGFLSVLRPYFLAPVYVMNVLRTSYARSILIDSASQTTNIANISLAKLRPLAFPLPPLAEQSRIVARVEELMRLCDALEKKGRLEQTQHQQLLQAMLDSLTQTTNAQELARHWQRLAQHFDLLIDRPEAVDALEQTILQLAVRGLLVEQDASDEPASELYAKIQAERSGLAAAGLLKKIKQLAQPEIVIGRNGWVDVALGDLIELISGQHLGPSEYVEGLSDEMPYLTGPAEFGEKYPTPSRSTNERRSVSIMGDILITVKGSGVGKLNIVSQNEIAISRQLMAIRPLMVNSDFIYMFLETMGKFFQEKTVGIAIPGIGREDVNMAKIGLPPFAEQSRIVARVTELRALCQQLRDKLTQARHTQTQLAQAWVEQAAA
ncbi:restriction endonuclease subunit S [Comamonas thiooxydans]|uniref:restriction endonuclease subunit S n=1 Tax=Comamonas thiooxydans TaxID=363952 RepID=UPI00068A0888|nr:restriction endonuclease subunit S [Comamonas thiooxydans]